MSNKLDEVVTINNLRHAAGARSYLRGEDYFYDGRVRRLNIQDNLLTGDVHGGETYHARISEVDGMLCGDCSCPMGEMGIFCKHLVALGLAYLDKRKKGQDMETAPAFSWNDFLHTCDKDKLIKIVQEMSPNNPNIIERYRLETLARDKNSVLPALKSKVDELVELVENVDDEDYGDYANEYDDFDVQSDLLLKTLRALSQKKEYDLLWEISSYAIEKFLNCANASHVLLEDSLEELSRHFLDAVNDGARSHDEVLKVFLSWEDKVENVGYFFLLQIFNGLPLDIRKKWSVHALQKWKAYPPRKLGDYSSDELREYLEITLLHWGEEQGDDALKLKILKKRMSSSHGVIELADEYCRQGLTKEVLPLLQKAHKELPQCREITDRLTKELQQSNNPTQALELAWNEFTKAPASNDTLGRLEEVAGKLKCWEEYYQKVLDTLETQDKNSPPPSPRDLWFPPPRWRQLRVEVLFSHGNQQEAWDLAQGARLSEDCWLTLADWRSRQFPLEAADVLKRVLNDALAPTGEEAYRHVIWLLERYRQYLQAGNNEGEFAAYCDSLRQTYKRRRLLMEQLKRAGF